MKSGSAIDQDLEKGVFVTPWKQNQTYNLLDPSTPSTTGIKKPAKQVTGRHNDTELHLAAQRGDLVSVKRILDEVSSQMAGTLSEADFDAEVAKIRASVVNEVNELGETPLYTAAERGHLEVVKELMKYSDKETLTRKSRSTYDPLHIAASQGHHDIVKLLLDHDESLSKTISQSNATPLITAAVKGHTAVVEELLSKDSALLDLARSDGKNALHLAARSGHVEIVKILLQKDPLLARRTDKKGQTALHMAAKGTSSEVVKLLLEADAAIVMLPDKFGFTPLHVATRKKRVKIVNELLSIGDINVNALTRDHKTALDIAEGLPLSEDSTDIRDCLVSRGAVRALELIQPRDELRNTMFQVKNDIHEIAKELRKLKGKGINNDVNSVTVAVLFVGIAYAAIFTVPGGNDDHGMAVVAQKTSFKIFFIFNAVALYTSLATVVIHVTVGITDETYIKKQLVEVINKLMWLAAVCTSVAFMASSYIVIGLKHEWIAVYTTVVGALIMTGVLGTMTYYVRKWKINHDMRQLKKE